ncbi:Cytoplasmic tRNA 2-thiolation protein 2 [Exophiala xenobiotica]|uniref:Cytoplasmic tRNA 2-thiolation protein 2 n=1 Tax=Lithohypha guttulata TaxID=1690604 RepID=A0ABR0KAS0_9EURO|nr:Cytoplasmic tRNA 2-thiolation protein 2 [Lithohypha guttulata]KAK5315403.1 Cytoplasmic tRNA 2-thiolation protein 2 [Exophiala xenobiotica]
MPTSTTLCVDCHSNPSSLEIRKRCLCHGCFRKYVASKILKRMETYRFKNQVGNAKKRLLLPVSGGVSSLVLLEVLDAQIKKQLDQQGRTAYDLVLVHVASQESDRDEGEKWCSSLRSCFELHTYLPVVRLSDVFEVDGQVEAALQLLGLTRQESETDGHFLVRVFTSARSATARSDLRELLLKRLIVATAKAQNCDGVIWGHSDSSLAAKALSEVAKGRGGSVPNELADGPSPWGLNFNYPLRDLFKTELQLYLGTSAESVRGCLLEHKENEDTPVSLRSTSIDTLLSTYITSQGQKYPSVMANVVRTASKLQAQGTAVGPGCRLCVMPITTGSETHELCYGCERMKQDIRE